MLLGDRAPRFDPQYHTKMILEMVRLKEGVLKRGELRGLLGQLAAGNGRTVLKEN